MFEPGTVVDQYEIGERTGDGSYGTVYAVQNIVTHQRYAMKVIPLHGIGAERELAAVKHCKDLHHPNLIQLHHIGIQGDTLYYTMDWAEDSYRTRPPSPEELLDHLPKLLNALKLLHSHGLIHRDIKPDNILWINGEVVLADIGLLSAKESISLAGSPGFIPPEVWKGQKEPDEYADLYALAKVVYCILSGKKASEYPNYHGKRDAVSSKLFNVVLAVCARNSRVRTADDFLNLLNGKQASRTFPGKYVWIPFLLLALLALFFLFKTVHKQQQMEKIPIRTTENVPVKIGYMKKQPEGHYITVDAKGNSLQCKEYDEYRRQWQLLKVEKEKHLAQIHEFTRMRDRSLNKAREQAEKEVAAMNDAEVMKQCPEKFHKGEPAILPRARGIVTTALIKKHYTEQNQGTPFFRYFELQEKLDILERRFGFQISIITKVPDPQMPDLFRRITELYRQQISLLEEKSR